MNIKVISTVPTNGSNEVQNLTFGGVPSGTSTFRLIVNGLATGIITWSATNATLLANIQAALDALIGATNSVAASVSLASGLGVASITFQNLFGVQLQQPITVQNNLGGTGTLTAAQTTPGVTASYRNAVTGQLIINNVVSPPATYQNISTNTFNPNWVAYPDTSNLP